MPRTLWYHPLFDCDLREATGWYRKRNPDLAVDFKRRVRSTVDQIRRNPERFGRIELQRRCAQVSRFPYLVLFELDGEAIRLLGVVHTARDLTKWRERDTE